MSDRLFHGIVPPVIMPLTPAGDFDADAFDRVVHYLLEAGVHGLIVLGTTGEGLAVSPEIRRAVMTAAVERAAGRVPVLVIDSSLAAVLGLSNCAVDAGARAVIIAPTQTSRRPHPRR
jgi:4-hydroxy-tetrahydrodipicolinate synthase